MRLRTRVGALAALGVGVAILLTALAAYTTVRIQLTGSVDEDLLARAYDAVPGRLGDPGELEDIPGEAFVASNLRVALLRADGSAFSPRGEFTAPPLEPDAELAVARGERTESIRTASLGGQTYRVVAVQAAPDFAFVLAQSTETVDEVLERLGLVSLLAAALGVGLAAWAGASIARAGLRPVERLTAAAEHVAATGSLDPIDVRGEDELARLARSFNEMLTALDEARLRQRRLVADAGHELKTPLTSLRTNLDLLIQSDRQGGLDAAEREGLLGDVRAQIEEMSTLVADLMELARDPQSHAPFERLDFADLVRDALGRARPRAPSVTFSADLRPFPVDGDATLLTRATVNLLDNAAKWSPPDGTVTVTLREGTLEVCDDGPGIADDDLPHVFERFYRSAEARGRVGSGLGLAIVRAAAERHGGTVEAGRASSGGARLTLTLPRPDAA